MLVDTAEKFESPLGLIALLIQLLRYMGRLTKDRHLITLSSKQNQRIAIPAVVYSFSVHRFAQQKKHE